MFSALKKLTHRSPEVSGVTGASAASPCGVNTMNVALQKKFARGVNYNLKLVIKGDRNTGKSCLLRRLQGSDFKEEYIPTDEIQVASIQWKYKLTDDIIKVEAWDVVDKGKKRKKMDGLKLGSAADSEEILEPALDAEFVDVYKGTHGVIFLFDVTKMWTFEYLDRELPKVPAHIPVLILANFIDRGHHRVVTGEQAVGFIEHFDRGEAQSGKTVAEIRYAESSMRNGFGLRFLHKFLNLPYLILQRESLLLQLETNKREIQATQDELDVFQESDDGQYEHFLNGMTQRRRNVAESLAPPPTVDVVVGQPSNTFKELTKPPPKVNENNVTEVVKALNVSTPPKPNAWKASPEKEKSKPTFSNDISSSNSPFQTTLAPQSSTSKSGKLDVDNFVPDQNAIDNFLDDDTVQQASFGINSNNVDYDEDDDESENVNPMVAGFTDDLDLDDFKTSVVIDSSDDDDDEVDNAAAVKGVAIKAVVESEPKKLRLKPTKNLFDVDLPTQQVDLAAESIDEEPEPRKKPKKKKSKKRSSKSPSRERDDLEDFLNGSPESGQPRDAAVYEEL